MCAYTQIFIKLNTASLVRFFSNGGDVIILKEQVLFAAMRLNYVVLSFRCHSQFEESEEEDEAHIGEEGDEYEVEVCCSVKWFHHSQESKSFLCALLFLLTVILSPTDTRHPYHGGVYCVQFLSRHMW